MRIDGFTHMSTKRFVEYAAKVSGGKYRLAPAPEMTDVDLRIRNMDEAGIDRQVVTISNPPMDEIVPGDPVIAADLATHFNDAFAEVAEKYPERIIPVGVVALSNVEASLKEAERAVRRLGMKGILIHTTAGGHLMHDPEILPFFELMASMDAPVWIHPTYNPQRTVIDYKIKFQPDQVFGWPFESQVAQSCLVYGGVFDKLPALKVIIHHAGAAVPYFEQRIFSHPGDTSDLKKPLMDYFRMFYVDTAVQGATSAVQAAYNFYGADHVLLGTDTPHPPAGKGKGFASETVASIQALDAPDEHKERILGGNLARLIGI